TLRLCPRAFRGNGARPPPLVARNSRTRRRGRRGPHRSARHQGQAEPPDHHGARRIVLQRVDAGRLMPAPLGLLETARMPVPARTLERNSARLMNAFAIRFVLGCLSVALSGLVMAQGAWPERPITLIVPFPAGGGVDLVARPFAERFSERLGKPVVVVNRDGASGTIGTAAVAAAKPDGYTLAFTASGPLTIQPHVIPTLAYKPDNLQPLCQVFASQYVFAVRSDSAFKSLDDFVNAVKAQPGRLTYGFGGVATSPHLAMA